MPKMNIKRFAKVDDEKLLKERDFSDSAPDWRVVGVGMHIDGVCDNGDCKAYDRMVCVDMGTAKEVDILNTEFPCPMCKESVEPKTCGFVGCKFAFRGTRLPEKNERYGVLLPDNINYLVLNIIY